MTRLPLIWRINIEITSRFNHINMQIYTPFTMPMSVVRADADILLECGSDPSFD